MKSTLLPLCLSLLLTFPVAAANVTWTNTGGGNAWLSATNWDQGVPGTSDNAQFGPAGTSSTIGIDLGAAAGNQAVGAITLLSTATRSRAITNSSTVTSGTLTLNGAGGMLLSNAAPYTLTISNGASRNLSLALGASGIIDAETGATNIISSVISETGGSRGFTKTGGGRLQLAASSDNTFSGSITNQAGNIRINNTATFGGGTLYLTGGDIVSANTRASSPLANPVVLSADANIYGDSAQASQRIFPLSGALSGSAGTLRIGNKASIAGSIFRVRLNGGGFTFGRPIIVGDAGFDNSGTSSELEFYNTAASGDQVFTGQISGGGVIWRGGVGGRTTLTGANTYSGGTLVTNGTLQVNNTSGTGTGTGTVTVTNAGVLGGYGSAGSTVIGSGGTISPATNLTVSALTLNGGGSYLWQITGASGTAGTDWDLITVGNGAGNWTNNAAAGNQFTIQISSGGATPAGWNSAANYHWLILQAGAAQNFDPTAFTLDTTGFTPPFTGGFSLSMVNGALYLDYTSGQDIVINVPAGQSEDQSQAGYPLLTGANVVKVGNGELVLTNAANSYVGSTRILAGTVSVAVDAPGSGPGALGNSSLSVLLGDTSSSSNATLNINTPGVTVGRPITVRAGSSGLKTIGGSITSGLVTYSGDVTLSDNLILSAAAGGTVVFGGSLSGSGAITKNGGGTAILQGGNSPSITTVSAGILEIDTPDSSGVGAGTLVVLAAGTLSGSGVVGGPVSGSGTIAPGPGPAVLTVTNGLDLSSGGLYVWKLSTNGILGNAATTGPGITFDQIAVTGGVLRLGTASRLTIQFSGTATAPDGTNTFWQAPRCWRIVFLGGTALNPTGANFGSILNGSFAAGSFYTTVDDYGIVLNYMPTVLTPGQLCSGRSNYIQYYAGDMPLIFSAPHGGSLTPSEISDRDCTGVSDCSTATDTNVDDLGLAVQRVFRNIFGHYPHVVICNLKRTKVDCNREIDVAAMGNVFAEQAWNEFQGYICDASNIVATTAGQGFYIDLHGQSHDIQRLELGYLLTATQLTYTDATLNQSYYQNHSSIRTLASQVPIPFAELLRGSNSFGGLMASLGYPSVPSPAMPSPGNGTNPIVYPGDQNPYFNGGYNTLVHSSYHGGPIDGLQIESNYAGVRDTAINRTNFAVALAQVMDFFFTNYYGVDLRLSAPCTWSVGSGNWATAANWGGTVPVSGNYLVFAGPGGTVTDNLAALTTGNGVVAYLVFSPAASGAYTVGGNAMTLVSGVTNLSSLVQTLNNAITLNAPQTFAAAAGGLTFGGPVTNAGYLLTVAGTNNTAFNSAVSGAGGLLKSGTGTLTLTGANRYSGVTTVTGGTLLVNTAGGPGTGTNLVVVNAPATLGGTGIIGGPVSGNGNVAPGVGSGAAQLTLTNGLNLASGGSYMWELAANSTNGAGASFDQIVLSGGNLALGPAARLVLQFIGSATAPAATNAFWQAAHTWRIVALSGSAANPGSTTFGTISNGSFAAGVFSAAADSSGILLSYTPAVSPVLSTSIVGAGTANATLSWSAVAAINYQLEYKTNLAQAAWLPVGTVRATNSFASLTDTNGPYRQSFYHVITVP